VGPEDKTFLGPEMATHYDGHWMGAWALKSRLFWALKWQPAITRAIGRGGP